MAELSELFTGERVVVGFFLARVLYSVPSNAEALALSLLSLAAFAIEIKAERSPASTLGRFKLRPCASSGILLGTITLPTVILARLTQLSRCDAEIEEFAYLRMQYWAVSMSCLGVLVFVYLTLSRPRDSNSSVLFNFSLFVCLGLHVCVGCLSHLDRASCAKMLWFVSHGVASVGIVWHILSTFPSCASIGEALLVSGGLVTYFGDMMACTLLKIDPVSFEFLSYYAQFRKKTEIHTIIQGFFFSLIFLSLLYKIVLQFWVLFTRSDRSKSEMEGRRITGGIGQSILFYMLFGVMEIIIAPSWMQFVNDFHTHPALWIIDFILTDPIGRLSLCLWWATIILVSVFWFYSISKHSKIERILLRKYYHLVAVVMFSPAVAVQPDFLDLAYGVAFSAFLALEVIRPDLENMAICHFSLLLGCAMPKWMSNGFEDRPLAPFAGILSLGIGDTMASVVGHKYGTLRWSKSGKKTIEGTAAGITSVLVACSILLSILASTGYILSQHWFSLLLAVTVSGLLEAYTMQLDNAFIPLVFYSLLCL